MLQITPPCASCLFCFHPHRKSLRTTRSRVSYTLPGLLTSKGLDTALVTCPTPGPRICRRNDTPQCHEIIAGNMLGNFHRQLNCIEAPIMTTNKTVISEQYIVCHYTDADSH